MPRQGSVKTALGRKLLKKLKNTRLAAVSAALVVVVLVVLLASRDVAGPKNSVCGPYRTDKVVRLGGASVNAEVAAIPAEQDKGLGGRPCILPDRGMLFVFDKPSHYAFWMKDMRFPIDIVWIGADHRVVGLEIDVQPSTYPDRFVNKDNLAQYVLELKAFRARDLHISIGSPIQF